MKFFRKLRALVRKETLDAEMADEMRAHLELQIEENIARGMPAEEARYAALRAFGGVEQVKEHARAQRGFAWLEHLAQDVRYARRQMRKHPSFTVVVVLSLAFGIGANSAIFSLIDDQLLSRLPVKNPDELVLFQWAPGPQGRPGSDGGDAGMDSVDPETGRRMRRVFSRRTFEAFRGADGALTDVFAVAAMWTSVVIVDGQAEMSGSGEVVSGNYFEALGVGAMRGRTLRPEDDRAGATPVVVISHRYWQTRFAGDPQAVGKNITINQTPVTIVGILPPDFRGVLFGGGADLTLPLVLAPHVRYAGEPQTEAHHWWLRIMGRLKPGATLAQAQASVAGAFQASAREGLRRSITLPRLQAVAGGYKGTEAQRRADAGPLKIATAIAGLVLLAACVNAANLLLARSAARRRELAVRLALGASRGRLVRQLLTESVLLALLGAALGLLFGRWGLDLLAQGTPPLNGWVVAFATSLALLTGIGFGLVPAWRATRLDLTTEFQGGMRNSSARRSRLGGVLVVVQVALSLVLLVGGGLFTRTVRNLRAVDVGFDRTHLLMFGLDGAVAGYTPAQRTALHERIAERIGAMPGVSAVTFSAWPMLSGWSGFSVGFSVPGHPLPSGREEDVTFQAVGANFFSGYRIPIVAGRGFEPRDGATGARVAIINQALARKYFGDENPVGQHTGARGGDGDREIIGVVRDVKQQDLRTPTTPTLYVPFTQTDGGAAHFAVRTAGEPATMAAAIRGAVREIDGKLPLFDVRTLDETVERNLLAGERFFARLSVFLALLALALVCVGLYGLVSYTVQRRTGEIGIRMALGALPAQVLRMILRESLVLVGIGVVAGIACAGAAARFIATMLYDLSPTEPLTYAGVALVLMTVAALACWLPARRAAKIDPLEALRCD